MKTSSLLSTCVLAGALLLQMITLCVHARGAAGDMDLPFNPSFDDGIAVNTVAVQPDGKVMIGGVFSTVNGLARRVIARLNADGGVDTYFAVAEDPNGGLNAVSAIALQSNGKALIGGYSNSSILARSPYVARLYGGPVLPPLSIARSGPFAILSWPSTAANFRLHESTDFWLVNSWSPVAEAVVILGDQLTVTLPTTAPRRFFRLQSQ